MPILRMKAWESGGMGTRVMEAWGHVLWRHGDMDYGGMGTWIMEEWGHGLWRYLASWQYEYIVHTSSAAKFSLVRSKAL